MVKRSDIVQSGAQTKDHIMTVKQADERVLKCLLESVKGVL